MIDWTKNKYGELNTKYPKYAKVMRFLISGGMATFVNIGLLYVFTDLIRIWYVLSAALAFIFAFVVSFTMQKFWTFKDASKENVHRQALVYFLAGLANLGLNSLLIYILVEYSGLHYLMSQIIISAFIAIENYFIYQFLVFNKKMAKDISPN